MPYKKQTAKKSKSTISENVRNFLLSGKSSPNDGEVFAITGSEKRLGAAWESVKTELIRDWISEKPCSRPWLWWDFDAPRETLKCYISRNVKEAQRRRLGGTGTADFEILAYEPQFSFGIPASWISKREEDIYNLRGVAIDPENPPCYESEATFLDRHGLLTESEKRYLAKHPEVLEPEKVEHENDKD